MGISVICIFNYLFSQSFNIAFCSWVLYNAQLWWIAVQKHHERKNIGRLTVWHSKSAMIKIVDRLKFGRLVVHCQICHFSTANVLCYKYYDTVKIVDHPTRTILCIMCPYCQHEVVCFTKDDVCLLCDILSETMLA